MRGKQPELTAQDLEHMTSREVADALLDGQITTATAFQAKPTNPTPWDYTPQAQQAASAFAQAITEAFR